MATDASGRCDFCKAPAIAYMRGARVCAKCGTTLTTDPARLASTAHRSFALAGISLGLAGKVLLTGVAVAATVTATAAGILSDRPPAPVESASVVVDEAAEVLGQTLVMPPAASSPAEADPSPRESLPPPDDDGTNEMVERALSLADAVTTWAECISTTAGATHGPIAPFEACGERPMPADFGISRVPGNGKSEAASTQSNGRDVRVPGPPEDANTAAFVPRGSQGLAKGHDKPQTDG